LNYTREREPLYRTGGLRRTRPSRRGHERIQSNDVLQSIKPRR